MRSLAVGGAHSVRTPSSERTRARVGIRLAVALVVAAAAATLTPGITVGAAAEVGQATQEPGAAAVVHWSRRAAAHLVPTGAPASTQVQLAKVHIALHDAVVAVRGGSRPFLADVHAPDGAAVEATVAAAAHGVLVGLLPAKQVALDDELAVYLTGLPSGPARDQGVAVGGEVARRVIAARAGDGMTNSVPFVQPTPGPGVFEPTPPSSTPVDVKLTRVRPYLMTSNDQFRPEAPPELTSSRYTKAFDEVARLGRIDSTERSAEQTQLARFWTEQTAGQWNRTLAGIAADQRLGTLATVRMLLVTNLAAADAALACWDAKYHYGFWRPVHATQRADTDGNPDTAPDPTWAPLVVGNHPEYPSGHSCFTSAVTNALKWFFDTDDVAFSVSSTVTGTSVTYGSFSAVVRDVRQARILGGLHFRFSMLAGEDLGRDVAHYVTKQVANRTG